MLVAHLEKYGIRRFGTDDYWGWARGRLGKDRAQKTDRLRSRALVKGARSGAVRRFYDWIARPEVSAVMHSMKAGAIAASGAAVAARLGWFNQTVLGNAPTRPCQSGTGERHGRRIAEAVGRVSVTSEPLRIRDSEPRRQPLLIGLAV